MAVFSLFFILSAAAFPQSSIEPRHAVIPLPKSGLTWLPGEDFQGVCEDVPAEAWVRKPCGPFDLLVHAEGPSGSGRYWALTAGIARPGEPAPDRGVCLQTSTLGWRTLQRFDRLPLPWAEDRDGDGVAELLIWDSFPVDAEEPESDFGLMAWVYRLDADEAFALDWDLTREMARELAAAYRSPLRPEGVALQKVRDLIARKLEEFVSEPPRTGGDERKEPMESAKKPAAKGDQPAHGIINLAEARSPLTLKPGDRFFYTYSKHGSVGLGAKYFIKDRTVVEFVEEKVQYRHPLRMMAGMTGADAGSGTFIFRALKQGKTSLIIRKDFRGKEGEELISIEIIVE